MTISCGVAIFPDDADDVDRLLQHADAAMREVKESRHAGMSEQAARPLTGTVVPRRPDGGCGL